MGIQSSSVRSTCQLSYSVKKHLGLSKNNLNTNCSLFSPPPPPPVHEERHDVVLPWAIIFGIYTSRLIIILHLPIWLLVGMLSREFCVVRAWNTKLGAYNFASEIMDVHISYSWNHPPWWVHPLPQNYGPCCIELGSIGERWYLLEPTDLSYPIPVLHRKKKNPHDKNNITWLSFHHGALFWDQDLQTAGVRVFAVKANFMGWWGENFGMFLLQMTGQGLDPILCW